MPRASPAVKPQVGRAPGINVGRSCVHAEPASECATSSAADEVDRLALWDDGTVISYLSARELGRAVR